MKQTDIATTCEAFLAPARSALKIATEAAALLDVKDKLEAELEDVNRQVLEAPDSSAALAFVAKVGELQAKVTVATIRRPIDEAAQAKASQAAEEALEAAIRGFKSEIIEPLHARLEAAAERLEAAIYLVPAASSQNPCTLPDTARTKWEEARAKVWTTEARFKALEALVPELPAAFDRVAVIEKAAALVPVFARK
jgi:hypothetical protein